MGRREAKIGVSHINKFYLSKGVDHQNEDFITYTKNEHLDEFINGVIQDVFFIVRDINKKINS